MTKDESSGLERDSHWPPTQRKVLKPFVHQVSGRAHMLTFDSQTLCKSLSKREWRFYNKLPSSLRNFTPRLKGLLFVQLVNENGVSQSQRFISSNVWLSNGNTFSDETDLNGNSSFSPLSNPDKDSNWNSLFERTLFKGLDRIHYNSTDGFKGHAFTVDKDQEAATEALGKNPWALRQHKREIRRTLNGDILRKEVNVIQLCEEIGISRYENQIQNDRYLKAYLLLEDATHNYNFPSILDLKIGTQLDRTDCSQEKKDKHHHLAKESSTGSLSLRIAGMQVYQVNTKQYLCRDKYYGRGLSTKGFKDALGQFLHNGNRTMMEVIPPVVARLEELRHELEKKMTYRFYASSVLIMYESVPSRDENVTEEKSIDANRNRSPETSGDDAKTFSSSEGKAADSNPSKSDVYMIDFAHSTFEGFSDDDTVFQGPDRDCLNALDNLISALNDILTKSETDGS